MSEQPEIMFIQINTGYGTTFIKQISQGAHDNPAPTLSTAGFQRPAGKYLVLEIICQQQNDV